MTNETEYLHSQEEDSLTENNTTSTVGEISSPDYMELYSSTQWLRFPRKIEAEFIADYYKSTVQTTRWAFTGGFLIYGLFGYLDMFVAPVSLHSVW